MIPLSSSAPRELPQAGLAKARLVRLIFLGTNPKPREHTARPTMYWEWELPEFRQTLGKTPGMPMLVNTRLPVFMGNNRQGTPGKTRKFIHGWRGTPLQDAELERWSAESMWRMVGTACVVDIVHSADGKFAHVETARKLLPTEVVPKAEHPLLHLDLDPRFWNPTAGQIASFPPYEQEMLKKFGPMSKMFQQLPEWMRKEIPLTVEFKEIAEQLKSMPAASEPEHEPDLSTEGVF